MDIPNSPKTKNFRSYFSGLKTKMKKRGQAEKILFKDWKDLEVWYKNKLVEQQYQCAYCNITEDDMYNLVMKGLIKSARFPLDGVISRGRGRGVFFEVDRDKHDGDYSKDNCVLACYFCNNDKSDMFDGDEYKLFIKDRYGFLKRFLS